MGWIWIALVPVILIVGYFALISLPFMGPH